MKKSGIAAIAGIAAGLGFLLFGKTAAAQGRKPPCGRMGDVDGDGVVSQHDADLIAGFVVHTISLTQEQLGRAKVFNGTTVTIFDAMLIAQYAAGIKDTFPVCSMP